MTGVSQESINRLWRAVVLQALLDAAGLGRSLNPSWPEWKHQQVKEDARKWLLDDSQDLTDACSAATIHEESLRKFALRLAKGDTQARRSLIEWRDTFAKQGRKPADELEVEQESYVQDEIF